MNPIWKILIDKSEAAFISAMEIYNKPNYEYREETFVVLALNAWELLFKAKLIHENHGDIRAIYAYERRRNRDESLSRKLYLKRNRAGNPQSISLWRAVTKLENDFLITLPEPIKANLTALIEVRDNAIHFFNTGPLLGKQVLEIGTASIKNYLVITKSWFERDLSNYNLFLMPLGFVQDTSDITLMSLNQSEKNLIRYLGALAEKGESVASTDYHVALKMNLSFQRSKTESAAMVTLSDQPNATKVTLGEEDIRKKYPWDYKELSDRLTERYLDFKPNKKYHEIRMPLKKDKRFVHLRLLDPGNPRSLKKEFYNTNILQVFDKYYTRK